MYVREWGCFMMFVDALRLSLDKGHFDILRGDDVLHFLAKDGGVKP